VKVTPVAKELMKEHGISVDDVIKGLKRLGKKEVEAALGAKEDSAEMESLQSPKKHPVKLNVKR
jgi:2-oxoglutarate dehydrogenase E2 component (dihydrolipoamide succinyltransferase)